VVHGTGLIGKEEQSGSLELLLASPVTRTRIVAEKLLALSVLLAMPVMILWLAIAAGKVLFGFDVNLMNVALACFSGWTLALVYGTLSFAVQSATGKNGIAVAAGTATLTLTYLLFVVSKLVESWEDARNFSPFYYFDNPGVLMNGLQADNVLLLLGLSLVFILIAFVGFCRRDTGV
jgi:ABC-2 type transport system permease protein